MINEEEDWIDKKIDKNLLHRGIFMTISILSVCVLGIICLIIYINQL